MKLTPKTILLACASMGAAFCQSAYLRPAESTALPTAVVDGNSPAFWDDGRLRVYTSTGIPVSMRGRDLLHLRQVQPPVVTPNDHYPLWIESVWRDDDKTVYGWYHHEPDGGCGHKGLLTPVIGALVSTDSGRSFTDLGIVLSSGDTADCDSQNGYFASGHGDFSVVLDQQREYFYFLFTNYGGDVSSQGVVVARMAFRDRANPVGAVYKYHQGAWNQPGNGGAVTPVYPAAESWVRPNTDSFWGPAVHWNTYLERYVMLLNRACCSPGWPQEGIYLAFGNDLADPASWSTPRKILNQNDAGFAPAYYPQVYGTAAPDTDTLAGETARLYVKGLSAWEIVFSHSPFEGTSDDGSHGPGGEYPDLLPVIQ